MRLDVLENWWANQGGDGYTTDIDDAMQVDEAEARSIEANKPDEDIAWPVKLIEAAATRHVTGDNLPSRQSDPAPAPSASGDLPDAVSTTSPAPLTPDEIEGLRQILGEELQKAQGLD